MDVNTANKILDAFYHDKFKDKNYSDNFDILNQAHHIVGQNNELRKKWLPIVEHRKRISQLKVDNAEKLPYFNIRNSDGTFARYVKGLANTADNWTTKPIRQIVSGRHRGNVQANMFLNSLNGQSYGSGFLNGVKSLYNTEAGQSGLVDTAITAATVVGPTGRGVGKLVGRTAKKPLVPALVTKNKPLVSKVLDKGKQVGKAALISGIGTAVADEVIDNTQPTQHLLASVGTKATKPVTKINQPETTTTQSTQKAVAIPSSTNTNKSDYLDLLTTYAKTYGPSMGMGGLLGWLLGGNKWTTLLGAGGGAFLKYVLDNYKNNNNS